MNEIKVVVIDNNIARRDLILSYLPPYVSAVAASFSKEAREALGAGSNGKFPDAVIMEADENVNQGLLLFDAIKSGEIHESLKKIPVILLTKDEFGDNCMDYLEIGDAVFYEGEPDEDRLFSTLMHALDEIDDFEDDKYDLEFYLKEEKSIEKVMGTTLSAPLRDDVPFMRSAVLDMDSKLSGIEAVMEKNMDKVSGPVKPLRVTNKIREDMGLPSVSEDEDIRTVEGPKQRQQVNIDKLAQTEDVIARSKAVRDRIRRQNEMADTKKMLMNNIRERMLNNSQDALNAQLGPKNLPTIVVVDDDETILANAKQFLFNRYNVVACESGMKAIDYFVRSKADLIIIDAVLGSVSGTQILNSIRWQPNGKQTPAIFMIGADYAQSPEKLSLEGVAGVMQKPFSGTSLTMAVESVIKVRK